MASIFISYRHEDSAPYAGRLCDRLHTHFGAKHQVFRDLETLGPGDPFVERIRQIVGSCDVLIAIIGRQWLTAVDDQERVRLKNPDDLVRLDIQTALERNRATRPAIRLLSAIQTVVRPNVLRVGPWMFRVCVLPQR